MAERNQQLTAWDVRFKSFGTERETEVQKLQAQMAERDRKLAEWDARYQGLASERDVEYGTRRARIAELEPLHAQLAERDRKLTDWDGRYKATVGDRDAEIARLRARMTEFEPLPAQLIAWEGRYKTTVGERDAEIARLLALLAEREAQVAKMKSLPASPPKASERDDLKRIWGIGPVLEKRLNGLGIYYFRQIAQWTREEVDYFSEQLKEFPDRIQRDNWLEGAADEHFRKYNERLSMKASGVGQS